MSGGRDDGGLRDDGDAHERPVARDDATERLENLAPAPAMAAPGPQVNVRTAPAGDADTGWPTALTIAVALLVGAILGALLLGAFVFFGGNVPIATEDETPSPSPSVSASPSVTPSPSRTILPTPTPEATAAPTPPPTPTVGPTPAPTATPVRTPPASGR